MNYGGEPLWKPDAGGRPGAIVLAGTVAAILLAMYAAVTLQSLSGRIGASIPPAVAFLALAIALLAVFVVWHNERIWLYSAILVHAAMMFRVSDGIGPGELLFGAVVIGGLLAWFAKEFLHRRSIVRSGFDALLAGFLFLGTFTAALGFLFHNGDLLHFYKEYSVVFALLLYFPLRSCMRSRRDVQILIAMCVVLACANSVVSLLTYKSRLASAVYAWEVESSRTAGGTEPFAIAMTLIGITLFAYARRWRMTVAGLALAGGGLLTLAITFSRGPMVAGVIGMIIVILCSPFVIGRRAALAVMGAFVAGSLVVVIMFPAVASTVGKSIAMRLFSATSGFHDLSLRARVVESSTLIEEYLPASPVFGYGFGVNFSTYTPIARNFHVTSFIHNGYVWAFYKFGIPVALLLFVVMCYPLVRLTMGGGRVENRFARGLMAGAVSYSVASLLMNLTSNQYAYYLGVFNVSFSWALLDYVNRVFAASTAGDRPLTAVGIESLNGGVAA
jgi:hypothetical protein